MESFTQLALSSLDFPDGMFPSIINTYALRYPQDLRRNQHLRAHGYALANQFLDAGNLDELRRLVLTGNHGALEAVLDSSETDYYLIQAVMNSWRLCVNDQMRLVQRDLLPVSAQDIFRSKSLEFCAMAQYEASARSGLMFSHSHYDPGEPPKYLGVTHTKVMVAAFNVPQDPPEHVTDMSMGDIVKFLNFRSLSRVLRENLGVYGLRSQRNWSLFLSLLQGSPDVPLGSVIASARALANAEAFS